MMRNSESRIRRLKAKFPKDFAFSAEFESFLATDMPIQIGWTSLDRYSLKKSAERELLPFITLGDGSLVAVWLSVDPPPVVCVDSHGASCRIIASGILEFLQLARARKTGLHDIDDASLFGSDQKRISIREPSGRSLRNLQAKLDCWSAENSSLQTPTISPNSENLRRKIMKVARSMLRDGRSKVYKVNDEWWELDFRIECGSGIEIEYLDYGQWYRVPEEYGMAALVGELRLLVKRGKKKAFEMNVCKDGIVSIDKDRELVLQPQLN
jgi:hypothetical protein